MKKILAIVFALSLFDPSSVLAQQLQEDVNAMMHCYELQGFRYGLETCSPPAELVDAVFGKCDSEERRVRAGFETKRRLQGNYSDDDVAQYSALMIRRFREEFRTKIQAQIVDARVTVNKRCNR
ncbi:hypothetical protein [Bradyrhizobium sp. USDA 10063]